MADTPVSSTVSAGGDALASQYNNLRTDLFDHTHDGIGDAISNVGIHASAAIVESKLLFSGSGHGHTGGADGKLIPKTRYFWFEVAGLLAVGNGQAVIAVPEDMTITKIKYRVKSGSATLRVTTVAGSQKKASIAVTTSYQNITSGFDNTTLTEGDELQLDLTGVSNANTLRVIVYATE